jgi:putative heme-binding domain-containing protein
MEAEAGGGQYGLAFDDTGRRFTCNNSDHIRVFMYDARYGARNAFFTMPPALQSIAVDGPAAEVYRTSPDEPWRLIRTRWRVSGAVPGMIEGGGRASGYFTSATGIMIYRGDAWPSDYLDDAFVADCGSNLIHRKKVRRDGIALRAERPADEQRVEFLTSRDTWFRPVQMANAPDGTLYIVDMYREIIEHPWSLPPSLKKHLDLNSGNDRGRIYRVVPDGYKPRKAPQLAKASTAELVELLAHPNGWHRDTAARLLYERQDRAAVPALEKLFSQSPSALGRMHALHALDGMSELRAGHLLRAFDDADPLVREHAIKLAEKFVSESSGQAAALRSRLLVLASDGAPTVRYQLAFTLGELHEPGRIKALAHIVHRDAGDSWIRAAVLSSLAEGSGEMFRETISFLANAPKADSAAEKAQVDLQTFLRDLVQAIGARNDSNEVSGVLEYVAKATDPALAFALVHCLGEGLQRARASLPTDRIQPVIDRATKLAADKSQPAPARVEAVELLALTGFQQSGTLLFSLLDLNQPQTVQLAAMHTLGRFADPKIGPEVAGHWSSLTPRLRREALTVLLARPERIPALLDAVEAGTIRRADLASPQIDFLTNHRDRDLRARAIKLLTAAKTSTRQEVVAAFQPALTLTGDAARGKKIFVERCASCHRLGGEGYVLGPDLVSVRNAGKEKLLISILDPSREMLPQYLAYEIETKDDESFLGILVNETATSVTLRQSYAKDTVVPRANIARMQSRGQSMMPEGLESNLKPQDMADLLEFVTTAPQ